MKRTCLLLVTITVAGYIVLSIVSCIPAQTTPSAEGTRVSNLQLTTPTLETMATLVPELSFPTTSPVPQKECLSSRLFYFRTPAGSSDSSIFLACLEGSRVLFSQQIVDANVSFFEFAASAQSLLFRDTESDITYLQLYPSGNREIVFDATNNVRGFSWSPDGEYISYARWGDSGVSVEILHVASHTISRIFNAGVGDITNLLPTATVWSPNGTEIATLSVGADGTFYHVINVTCDDATHMCTSEQVREIPVAEQFLEGWRPSWANDSSHLLLGCGKQLSTQVNELCMVDLSGRVVTRYNLSQLGFDSAEQAVLSPDGTTVALHGSLSSTSGVFGVNLDTQEVFQVATESHAEEQAPVWGYPSP